MTKPSNSSPLRIIVADDHEWILQILVTVVRDTLPSAEIVPLENGLEALRAFEQNGADFLVTNHQMPKMDGVHLIRQVRRLAPDLPILMVSVHPEVKTEALAAGATWFLSKAQIMEQLPPLLRRYAKHGSAFSVATSTENGPSS